MMPLGIVLVGLLAYSNAFHGEFVFDDLPAIVDQPLVRDLDHFVGSLEAYRQYPNRFLTYFTFALNYAVGGLDARGYHALNILIHLGTALLVYSLCLLLFRTPHLRRSALALWSGTVAFVTGLAFATHPLQTQAVTYVVQRLTSLATLFSVLAVVLYLRWRLARDEGRARGVRGVLSYAAVLVSLLAAMKSKEIALTVPILIGLCEFAFFEGPWRTRLVWLAPILATLIVIPIGIFGLHQPLGKVLSEAADIRLQTEMARSSYFATQLTVVVRYLRLLLWPTRQNLDYDFAIQHSLLAPRVVLSAGLLLALLSAALVAWGGSGAGRARRTRDPASRLVSFGILWFFITLSLESSIFPIVDVIFEHRVYLPSVGFLAAATTLGGLVAHRIDPARAARRTLIAGVGVSLALAAATHLRNRVWATDVALWTDVVSKSPNKSRARDNLGLALAKLGREPEAIVHFREAVRADPANVLAWNNLGVALGKLGRRDEALSAYMAALRADPSHAQAPYNIGRIRLEEGRYADAEALFQQAIARDRSYWQAYTDLAAAWNQLGRHGETIRLLEDPAVLGNLPPEARFNLGVAYVATGNRAGAEREIGYLSGASPPLAAGLAEFAAQTRRSP
jgi:Flp pilus assembly protein TadD